MGEGANSYWDRYKRRYRWSVLGTGAVLVIGEFSSGDLTFADGYVVVLVDVFAIFFVGGGIFGIPVALLAGIPGSSQRLNEAPNRSEMSSDPSDRAKVRSRGSCGLSGGYLRDMPAPTERAKRASVRVIAGLVLAAMVGAGSAVGAMAWINRGHDERLLAQAREQATADRDSEMRVFAAKLAEAIKNMPAPAYRIGVGFECPASAFLNQVDVAVRGALSSDGYEVLCVIPDDHGQ